MSDSGLAAHTGLMPSGAHTFVAQYGSDAGLRARFYKNAIFLPFKSEQEGRACYEDRVFVEIERPGAKSNLMREARMKTDGTIPTDPERFPRQWQQFQNEEEQTSSGLPLEMWAPLSKAQVLELKGAKIFSVEELASIPDSILQNIGMMDARRLRDLAHAFVNKGNEGAELSKALSTIENQRADIEALKAQFAQLAEERATEKRGPGRPRKDENHDNQA